MQSSAILFSTEGLYLNPYKWECSSILKKKTLDCRLQSFLLSCWSSLLCWGIIHKLKLLDSIENVFILIYWLSMRQISNSKKLCNLWSVAVTMLCTGFIFINTQLLHRISINSIAIKFRVDALMLPVRYSYQTSCCIDASILLSASVIIFTSIILFPYMLVLNACLVLLCLPCVLPSFFFSFAFIFFAAPYFSISQLSRKPLL